VLPFGKSVRISYRTLRARFFRALVTAAALVLAVAFLGYTLASLEVSAGLFASGDPRLREALVRAGFDPSGVGATERWIVALSLLVCGVGIVNAQLMAVTERFREIGTMKCLGALDSFVLRLFLLEAAMQGLAGSLAGAVLGAGAALALGTVRFGPAALAWVSWSGLLRSMALSTLVGLVLSLAGVAYPAVVAARMQPVEAMRAEE
jgi:hypothetical protein